MKKKTIIFLIMSILILSIAGGVVAQNLRQDNVKQDGVKNQIIEFQSDKVKIEKAKEEIEKFSGYSSANLEYKKTQKTPDGNVLHFGSKDLYYTVNEDGQVIGEYHTSQSWKSDVILNDAEALEKASAHADQKYASMKSKNMKILNQGMIDRGDHKEYWYFWREEKDGILTPNYVSIVLNPYCGEIASYNCRDIGDIFIPNVNLSKDDAITIAKEKHPYARSIKADLDIWLTREGAPLLRWTVAVSLPDRADGTAHGLTYMINAETGEVYEVTGY